MGKLKDRLLPNYTFGEELFNMISHIAGAFLGMVVLTMCVARCAVRANAFGMIIICGLICSINKGTIKKS